MPRISIRTKDMEDEIISRLAEGTPLAEICRDDGMPHPSTWRDWCNGDETLALRYARAREDGFAAIAAETFAIADDGRNDWMEKFDKEGQSIGWALNGEHVKRSQLRIETRLKLLAIWDPKRYGPKVQHTGADGTGPVQVITAEMSPQEAAAAYQAAIKGG